MSKGLEYYKDFIDGLVERKNGVDGKRILGKGYPDNEENQPYNELLASLTDQQKEVLAKLVQKARLGGIHDTLAYMNEMMDCDGLVLSQNGEPFSYDEFESMHYDFICRCEGDEWCKGETDMTREEIIKALEDGITSWGMYNVNWDAMDAIEADAEPFSYVQPILDIIAAHPDIDFGTPGQLVHFVEKFSNQGYEELLIESVRKSPTPHNIWMVHRCYNDPNDSRHEEYAELIKELRERDNISDGIKNTIDEFSW